MIQIQGLQKNYGDLRVLKDINLTIEDGDIYGLVGRSGAGKSTLLRCINGLDTFQRGTINVNGVDVQALSPRAMRVYRKDVGMIFQQFSLIDRKTVYGNISIPMECWRVPRSERDARIAELLKVVDLEDKRDVRADNLSGGQMQRVAIARALAMNPKVLLSDEATSALDPRTTREVLHLLREINASLGITIIVVTHQMSVVQQICNKMCILEEGVCKEAGSVREVFQRQSPALINLLGHEDALIPDEGVAVRLTVADERTGSQILSQMAIQVGVPYRLLDSSMTRYRDGQFSAFTIHFDEPEEEKFFAFFRDNGISYAILNRGEAANDA